ncbi:hypothetical protein PTKIN_Ptkin16aG0053200 [Pterospermum kingtungense]
MASSTNLDVGWVSDMYASLSIADEEDGGVVVEDSDLGGSKEDFSWCLVSRLWTNKGVNFPSIQNTLASLWCLVNGVCIKDLRTQVFLFQFFHEFDVQRVEKGGSWTFNQHLLLTKRLHVDEKLLTVPLFHMPIWVQAHNFPIGFMPEKICKAIGDFIRGLIELNPKNFDGIWKSYMQICVNVDVRTPSEAENEVKMI